MKKKISKRPKAHQTVHKTIPQNLGHMAMLAKGNLFQATLQRLIHLLESYGRVSPVTPVTKVGPASNDLDTLRADINEKWDFPSGKKFNSGDISSNEATQTLARDIDNRGGVPNGQ
jgi:hypothetical protein